MRWAIVTFLLVTGAAARAQEPSREVKKLFEAGVQAYEQARYAEAAQAFERANQMAPRRHRIVFALAQSLRRQYFIDRRSPRLLRAVELYREYLELAPEGNHAREVRELLGELGPLAERLSGDTDAPATAPAASSTMLFLHGRLPAAHGRIDDGPLKRLPFSQAVTPGRHRVHFEARGYQAADFDADAVEGELVPVEARLRELPAVLVLEAPGGAGIDIDGRPFGDAPLAGALALSPGRHVITVTQRGRTPWRREVELHRGGELHLEAQLEPTARRRLATWFLIGGGTLVTVAALGGLSARASYAEARDILARREQTGVITADDISRYNDLRQSADRLQLGAIAVLLVGVGAGVTGGLLYWFDTPRPETPPSRPLVTPTLDEDSLGVRVTVPY